MTKVSLVKIKVFVAPYSEKIKIMRIVVALIVLCCGLFENLFTMQEKPQKYKEIKQIVSQEINTFKQFLNTVDCTAIQEQYQKNLGLS